jgi:biopolymer transport protein TolQ
VIFYNKLNQDTEAVIGGYEGFADEFSMILSRQLDRAA